MYLTSFFRKSTMKQRPNCGGFNMRKMIVISLVLIVGIFFITQNLWAKEQKIGVMWIGSSGMANRILTGVEDAVKEKNLPFLLDIKKDLPDDSSALDIYNKFMQEKDAVIFLRSNGVQFLAAHPPQKPAFIGGCNNPVALGGMKDLKKPGGNFTGVTYYLPAERQLKVFKMLFPKLARIALVTEKDHPSSSIDIDETADACKSMKLEFHTAACSSVAEIESAVKDLAAKNVELIIIGNQALIIDNAETVAKAAGIIPVVSYAEKPIIQKHALCGLVPDDEKLGRMLVYIIEDVLVDGKNPGDLPVQTDPEPKLVMNMPLMKKLNLEIPAMLQKFVKKIE